MRLIERLTVNGEVLPISGYNINTPTDGLGQSVNIALARPDIDSIPIDADITFEIGAKKWNGSGYDVSYAPPIIAGGKLNGRSYTVRWIPDANGGFPGDVINFTSMSAIADKFAISPSHPIILYDPVSIDPRNLTIDPNTAIKRNGVPILPELIPKENLDAKQVMDYAYGALGFSRVISNLPHLPVDKVEFTLEGGYHAAVKGIISFFDTLTFEHGTPLWIIDPEEGVPSGLDVKTLSPNAVVEVVENLNPEITSNAVILQYNNPAAINAGELPQESFIDDDPIESGTGHSYTRVEVTRHVTQYVDILSGEVRRTQEHEIETRHFAYRDNIVVTVDAGTVTRDRQEGGVVLISKEIIENTYAGNEKTGHIRTVEGIYTDPEDFGRDAYGLLHTEVCSLNYGIDNAHPGENLLEYTEMKTRGLVVAEAKDDGYIQYTPILDAMTGAGLESDGSQYLVADKPIETYTERFRQTSQNQSNVTTTLVDHLGGNLRSVPPVQSRTGSRTTFTPFSLGNRPNAIREIIEAASVATIGLRHPINFDVGRLDAAAGRRLSRRKLQRLERPPKTLAITQPGIDFSLRRGSLLICPIRSGFEGKAIITGMSIQASGIGTPEVRRVQSIEAKELLIDE